MGEVDVRRMAPAPRSLSIGLKIAVLLEGATSIAGWLLLGAGLLTASLAGRYTDVLAPLSFLGEVVVTEGRLVAVSESWLEVNEREVVAHHFSFSTPGGRHEGVSFATDTWRAPDEAVQVEYPMGSPERARIAGMRGGELPWWAFGTTLVMPLMGLVMVWRRLRTGVRTCRLLRVGVVGWARLLTSTPTSTRINGRRVYAYEFGMEVDGASLSIACRTPFTHLVEDDPEEAVLFDPKAPTDGMLVDILLGHPRLDERGGWVAPDGAYISVLLPGLALGLNAILLWVMYAG